MNIAIIVAMAMNGCIGRHGQIPWRIPEDLRFFKKTTLGHPIIMGRKTFDSIGKPLPGRHNIVITRSPKESTPDLTYVTTMTAAMIEAEKYLSADATAFVIGGGEIYKDFLPFAETVYITHVPDIITDGDVFFPTFNAEGWDCETVQCLDDPNHGVIRISKYTKR